MNFIKQLLINYNLIVLCEPLQGKGCRGISFGGILDSKRGIKIDCIENLSLDEFEVLLAPVLRFKLNTYKYNNKHNPFKNKKFILFYSHKNCKSLFSIDEGKMRALEKLFNIFNTNQQKFQKSDSFGTKKKGSITKMLHNDEYLRRHHLGNEEELIMKKKIILPSEFEILIRYYENKDFERGYLNDKGKISIFQLFNLILDIIMQH